MVCGDAQRLTKDHLLTKHLIFFTVLSLGNDECGNVLLLKYTERITDIEQIPDKPNHV